MSKNQTYLQWLLEANEKDPDNMCDAPLPYYMAVHFLTEGLLGPDWYVVMPESGEQVANAAVFAILQRYSKSFRKEMFRYECITLSTNSNKFTLAHRWYLLTHPKIREKRHQYQSMSNLGYPKSEIRAKIDP